MPIPALAVQPRIAAPADLVPATPARLRELTVADGASADIGELTASVHTRLLLLGPSGRALARISSAIEGCRPDVLHIVAHGRTGAISLGGEWIGARELAAASGMLGKWRVATIALWSCHGGADQTLGQLLAALTGARVLVSPGALGMVDGAPQWELVDAYGGALPWYVAPFDPALMRSWPHQLAKLSFVNAYAVNTATTPAAKEANSVDIATTSLHVTRIDDRTGGVNFSGNDVVVEAQIDGITYFGWVSRPIKSGGVVRGYYFWTDPQFGTLAAATADGNADGDSNALDNRAFVLVVDQAWFDAQPTFAGGTLRNVGTSSDRVDAGLNALLAVNTAPAPLNDAATALEDGGALTGNVLANDSDANNDSLVVTGFAVGGSAGTLGVARTIAGVGSFTLQAGGAWSFTPSANYAGPVPLVSYTVSDGRGGMGTASLSLSVARVNDAPSGADKTVSAPENTTYTFSASDFGFLDAADTPANSLAGVVITTLPAHGSLSLNGAPVSAGAEVAAADLTRLKFTPAQDGSGAGYASFTFQVRDSGGGADLDPSANTITFNIQNVNNAPQALADSGASGNLLANDLDVDTGDAMSVIAAAGKGNAAPVGTGTVINGSYGHLTVSADGSYSYTADTANAAVKALASSAATLTDTFTYTMQDSGGLTSSASLAVTVQGANDPVTAVNDFNFAIASTIPAAQRNPSGNLLANDSDPDAGDTMAVTRASAGATLGGTIVTIGAANTSASGDESRLYAGFQNQGLGNVQAGTMVSGTGVPPGTTVASVSNTQGTRTVLFNNSHGGLVALDGMTHVTIGSNSYAIEARVQPRADMVALTNTVGTVVAGMQASGTGIQSGTIVNSVSTAGGMTLVTLSKSISGTLGADVSFGSTTTNIAGQYGILALTGDGGYTYTFTHATPVSAVETFTYEVSDSQGAASTARLTIDVVASNVAPPSAGLDTGSAVEDGAAAGGNVLANDVQNTGVKAVSHAWTPSAYSMTAVTAGGVTLAGRYGTLTIAGDGSYSYAPDNANAAVNALAGGQTLSETFSYRIGSSSDGYASATLTVTIAGANDAPVAAPDTATAREAGISAGVNPSGNLLANDSDPDHGAVLAVTHGGTSSAASAIGAGLTVSGAYGALTISANGAYQYAVDNANAAVQAMNAGASLTDTFTYAVSDGAAARTATLTVTVAGANDAPTLATGAGPTLAEGASAAVTGISVADVDDATLSVALSVDAGVLAIGTLGAATISAGASGSAAVTLSGSPAAINAALATLSYQGAADWFGVDNLRISAADGAGLVAVASVDVTVNPDNRPLTVTAPTVNEASPYAIFTVGGAAGQKVTLALETTGSGGAHAEPGADYADSLEYHDGAAWHAYTGQAAPIPAGGALLVRAAILNDMQAEGAESFRLAASNRAGAGAAADAIIVDDGSGATFSGSVSGGTPDSAPVNPDDDRALSVTSSTVNEKSAYAMFSLGGAAGQQVVLSLANGNAGDLDHGTSIDYWDGAAWQTYGGALTLGPSGSLKLRVAVSDDGVYEGPEVFGLVATNGSGRSFVGTATIVDDGTGLRFPGTLSGGAVDSTATNLDNDLSVAVTAHGPVNEGSTYATFTVSATAGEVLELALAGSGSSPAGAHAFGLAFSTDGSTWTAYDSSTQPVVPHSGTVFVRADIGSEHDAVAEGAETFTLTASIGSGAGASAGATGTIVDDGSGSIYAGTFTLGAPGASTTGLDHDVLADTAAPTITITGDLPALGTLGVGATASVTFTLSEASSTFDANDVTVSGGTLSGFTAVNGARYSATFTPAAGSTANGVIHVASGAFGDHAGNLNTDGGDADNTLSMRVDTVVAAPPPPPVNALPAPSVTIVTDQDDNGILSRAELQGQGQVGVRIGLPDGARAGDVLTVSDGGTVRQITLTAAAIGAGSVSTSFSAPAANGAISVSASVAGGASGSDSAVRGSGVGLAVTAISPDTGVEGDFITSARNLVFSGTAETGTLVTVKLNGTTLGNVLAVNDRWSWDNSAAPLTRPDNELTVINGNDPRESSTVMIRSFSAELNPASDDGASNSDRKTSVTNPDFILKAENIMVAGDSARLLSADGRVVGSMGIDAAVAAAGLVDVPTEQLDDGTYTFMAQILDAAGNVKAEQPVTVTIVTDRDGVMPSVELAAHGGDFNRDGILDWKQNNVAQLPLTSVQAFAAGKAAPQASFGAIMAGAVASALDAVKLDPNAQLLDVGVSAAPAPLPSNTVGVTPMLGFTVMGAEGAQLSDLDPGRAGLQTRVVIDLPSGVNANTFLKFDQGTGQWYSFVDDGRLDTLDDGATLLDMNGDGRIDRMVITLTDGARGDEDGLANGVIVDPGMLAMSAAPVYSVRLANGDRYYTVDARDAARAAAGAGNVFEGARFDSLSPEQGGRQMHAKWQPFTRDWYFGADGQADPYLCYELVPTGAGFLAAGASGNVGQRFHLYQDRAGQTQLVTQDEAQKLGLAAKGFGDRGAQFSTTTGSAFSFDPEAYLIANKDDAATRAFVQTLAAKFKHSGDAGYLDAVEQHYLGQVALVGVAHGDSASVAELNAVFGTQFLS